MAKKEEDEQSTEAAAKTPKVRKMTFAQYAAQNHPDLHRYARSYLNALHNDTLKTEQEWQAEMAFHGLKE